MVLVPQCRPSPSHHHSATSPENPVKIRDTLFQKHSFDELDNCYDSYQFSALPDQILTQTLSIG